MHMGPVRTIHDKRVLHVMFVLAIPVAVKKPYSMVQ